MAIQCVLFGVKRCRTFISAYRLTRIQSLRASVSTATQHVKSNDITSILSPLRSHVRVNSFRNAYTFTSTAVAKDVILFKHDRTRFFRLLAIFCGGQFVFWAYLAHFAFTSLRDTRKISGESQKVRTELGGLFSFDMNLGSNAWRYGFTLGCLIIGKLLTLQFICIFMYSSCIKCIFFCCRRWRNCRSGSIVQSSFCQSCDSA